MANNYSTPQNFVILYVYFIALSIIHLIINGTEHNDTKFLNNSTVLTIIIKEIFSVEGGFILLVQN